MRSLDDNRLIYNSLYYKNTTNTLTINLAIDSKHMYRNITHTLNRYQVIHPSRYKTYFLICIPMLLLDRSYHSILYDVIIEDTLIISGAL